MINIFNIYYDCTTIVNLKAEDVLSFSSEHKEFSTRSLFNTCNTLVPINTCWYYDVVILKYVVRSFKREILNPSNLKKKDDFFEDCICNLNYKLIAICDTYICMQKESINGSYPTKYQQVPSAANLHIKCISR